MTVAEGMIDFRRFGGLVPRIDAKMLPDDAAQVANNCKLWNGILAALRAPKLVAVLTKTGTKQSVYRLPYLGNDYWLHWTTDVDAARSPIAGDTRLKLLYTGDGEPRVTNAEMAVVKTDVINGVDRYPGGFGEAVATDYPRAFYALGVPAPPRAPVIGIVTGGIATIEGRAYVMTFVNVWGEESGPSPPSNIVTDNPDGSWALSQLMDTAPLNTGSVVAATVSATTVKAYTSAPNYLQIGHKITVTGTVGLTDLNASWSVLDAANVSVTTVSRARTAGNVVTLVLSDITELETQFNLGNTTIQVATVGAANYNGTWTLLSVTAATKSITYNSGAGGAEATTPDTAGTVTLAWFSVSLVTAQAYVSGGTWTRKAPWNVTNMRKRLYRVVSGVAGQDYKLVAELALATTTYADILAAAALSEILPTADPGIPGSDWSPPPGDLIGIIELPGEMLCGFRQGTNQLCFSEPGFPYAWPIRYRETVSREIVGIGVWGATVTVCTKAFTHRYTGYHPAAMSASRTEEVYPCVSKRSVVSGSAFGVVFATDRGLARDAIGGTTLITRGFYDRLTWQEGISPATMLSMEFDDRYFGFWPVDANSGGALIFNPTHENGTISTNNFMVNGVWFDNETGRAYVINSSGVNEWDADDANKQVYEWKSRKILLRHPEAYKAGKVVCTFGQTAAEAAAIAAANVAIMAANAAIIAAIPVGVLKDGSLYGEVGGQAVGVYTVGGDILSELNNTNIDALTFEYYRDGTLHYSVAVRDSLPFRIVAGTMAATYVEIRVIGNVDIQNVQIAPSMSELALM